MPTATDDPTPPVQEGRLLIFQHGMLPTAGPCVLVALA
jgi:hypothetical protein